MDPQPAPRSNLRLIIPLVLVALAIGGGALLVAYTQKAPSASDPVKFTNSVFSREAVVSVGGDGFTPSTLTVAPHTRVTWKSSDGQAHHLVPNDPAQADGPATDSHNDPQLPNGAGITADGPLTHIFEKAGIYIFHDQDNPTANVSITVN